LGAALLTIARSAIEEALGARGVAAPLPDAAALAQPGATFVTLRKDGELRGCIGSLEPRRTLADDVRANALAAAFRDPRFPPLRRDELAATEIEVSLLGPSSPLACADEADLLARLEPGVDGLILEHPGGRATFLPQVWEALPQPCDFLAALKHKAGLPADYWTPSLAFRRYGVGHCAEREFAGEETR
jgi:AmmeMemoRadiSam system protein A